MKKKRFAGVGIIVLFCICVLCGKTAFANPLAIEEQVTVHLTAQEEKEAEQNGKAALQALGQSGINLDSDGFTGSETLDKDNIVTNELSSAPYSATLSTSNNLVMAKVYYEQYGSGDKVLFQAFKQSGDSWVKLENTSSLTTYNASHIAICSIDMSGCENGTYLIRYYKPDPASGPNKYISFASYVVTKTASGCSLKAPAGEHEFYYYKNLANTLDPALYDEIPEKYYTADTGNYYYVGDRMDAIKQQAVSLTSGCTTDEQKVKVIHDWICEQIAYDYEYLYSGTKSYKLTAAPYYVYASKTGVCAGYSRLNQVMLTSLGIPCIDIMGYSDSPLSDSYSPSINHEWNMAYFGGEWHLLDLTWDSQNRYYGTSGKGDDVLNQSPGYTYYGIRPYIFGVSHHSTNDDKDKQYHVESIQIISNNSKTKFNVNDTFSCSLSLKVTLSDGSTKTVTSQSMISCNGYDMSKSGRQTVTVSYGGKSTSYTIMVGTAEACKHTLTTWETVKQANCYVAGLRRQVCESCGEEISKEPIPATGNHGYGAWKETKAPDCITKGEEKRYCQTEGCVAYESREIAATGIHSYGAWTVVKQATYDAVGEERQYCRTTGCSAYESRDIEKLKKTESEDQKKDDQKDDQKKDDQKKDDQKQDTGDTGNLNNGGNNNTGAGNSDNKDDSSVKNPGIVEDDDWDDNGDVDDDWDDDDYETEITGVVKVGKVSCVVTFNTEERTAVVTQVTKKSLTSVMVPDTVTYGGKPYKVTEISDRAFYNCKKLKSVTIGKNIKKIGSKAFYNCKNLKKITVKTKKLTTKSVGTRAFGNTYKKVTVKVPASKYKTYKKLFVKKGINKKAKFRK
ncbi:leucine-rich repeat protein [Kineothrix sp. MSJ-39]|uniref:leucine-rich repeat protein n=1 Tax=Kineothrix sp. MSJ-39 TaxID=2841533 RepID=UPI001C11887D|nr:leucine-rich repeat protein [Kineothrix sp. MSJ-39]MBU5430889.1 leucine-rich repeat protein [Kineothrix sp. MSJ-39]